MIRESTTVTKLKAEGGSRSLAEVAASTSTALGMVLGLTALMMMPICWMEGWRADGLITVMLALSLISILGGCHFMDRREARRKATYDVPPANRES